MPLLYVCICSWRVDALHICQHKAMQSGIGVLCCWSCSAACPRGLLLVYWLNQGAALIEPPTRQPGCNGIADDLLLGVFLQLRAVALLRVLPPCHAVSTTHIYGHTNPLAESVSASLLCSTIYAV